MELSCPLGISCSVPQDQRSVFGVLSHIINPLLTKGCSVKMAGYWPHSFFACLWTRQNLIRKNRTWPISSHLDLTLGQ